MSESKHTPGLLSLSLTSDVHVKSEAGEYIGTTDTGNYVHDYELNEANARRWVAAWNACANIPTEALEAGVVAEMVEALKKAEPVTSAMAAADNAAIFQEAADAVDAILAKIGGAS